MKSVDQSSASPHTVSIEPRFLHGIEAKNEVVLVDRFGDSRIAIPFDRSAHLDASDVDRLRQYLIEAPRAELDAIFDQARGARMAIDRAEKAVERLSDNGSLVLEGYLRAIGKAVLAAGVLTSGPQGVLTLVGGLAWLLYTGVRGAQLASDGSKLSGFVKGALDLSYLHQAIDAVLSGNDRRQQALAALGQERAVLREALDLARDKLIAAAKTDARRID